MNPQLQTFQLPGMRIFPAYWISSAMFTILAIDMVGSRGWAYAVLPIALTVVLPFLSYLSRSSRPCGIELDIERQTITQIYKRFGKTKRTTLDARQFSAFRLHITISRFPLACLQMHTRDASIQDVELALMDTIAGDAKIIPTDALPQVLIDIASVLEKSFSLVNLSK
jgi:hypothetical protein